MVFLSGGAGVILAGEMVRGRGLRVVATRPPLNQKQYCGYYLNISFQVFITDEPRPEINQNADIPGSWKDLSRYTRRSKITLLILTNFYSIITG